MAARSKPQEAAGAASPAAGAHPSIAAPDSIRACRAAVVAAIDAAGGRITPAIAAELGELLLRHCENAKLAAELAALPASFGELPDPLEDRPDD